MCQVKHNQLYEDHLRKKSLPLTLVVVYIEQETTADLLQFDFEDLLRIPNPTSHYFLKYQPLS